jgi:hypothetical protein
MDNIENLSTASKEDAVTGYIPKEQIALVCIGDTSYIYDERAESWATWSMPFRHWCLYDTTSNLSGPGEKFYFVRPNSSTLCLYHPNDTLSTNWTGSGTKDTIVISWESGALLKGTFFKPQITGVNLYVKNGLVANTLYMNFYDEAGIAVTDGGALAFDSLSERTRYKEKLTSPSQYFRAAVSSSAKIANTAIDRIDLYYQEGERIR